MQHLIIIYHIIEVIYMDYRERMRALREDHDLSQAEVGQLLNKSQQGYSHIENGKAELKIDDLVKLCEFYNVTADYLVGMENQPGDNAKRT